MGRMADDASTKTTAETDQPRKTRNLRRYMPLLLILLAFGLSFGIVRWHEMRNISPCVVNFACNDELDRQRGNYRKTQYGFPLTYRATESFTRVPDDRRTYATVVREFQPFNAAFAALNVLFWTALLYHVSRFLGRFGTRGRHDANDGDTDGNRT